MLRNYLLYRHSLISVEYFRPLHCGGIVDRDPPDIRELYYTPDLRYGVSVQTMSETLSMTSSGLKL